MNYKIVIDKPAMKFLQKQPQSNRERLLKAIGALPDAGDVKPLSGHRDLYRLRVGDLRIIYSVEKAALLIRVITIGNRGDVYK